MSICARREARPECKPKSSICAASSLRNSQILQGGENLSVYTGKHTWLFILKATLPWGPFSAGAGTECTIIHTVQTVWSFQQQGKLLLLPSLRRREEISQENKHLYITLMIRKSVNKTSPKDWIPLYLSSSPHSRIFCTLCRGRGEGTH